MKFLKRIRAFFWFIQVDPWRMWTFYATCGPRIQVFRNRRYPDGKRMYTHYRWGGQILGLQIGDRGGSRNYVRRQLKL